MKFSWSIASLTGGFSFPGVGTPSRDQTVINPHNQDEKGSVGGAVNAFTAGEGFLLPRTAPTSGGARIWQPGGLGTILIGVFAAGANWGLYGPFSSYFTYGDPPANSVGVTLAALVTAALVGYVGSRWLTNEVDKKLLRTAAATAAAAPANPIAAVEIATATPLGCLEIASGQAASPSAQTQAPDKPPSPPSHKAA